MLGLVDQLSTEIGMFLKKSITDPWDWYIPAIFTYMHAAFFMVNVG